MMNKAGYFIVFIIIFQVLMNLSFVFAKMIYEAKFNLKAWKKTKFIEKKKNLERKKKIGEKML